MAKCHEDIPCEQCDVSERLACRYILKSIVQEMNEKIAKITLLQPATKLLQGNVFTGICDSVHRGALCQGDCPLDRDPP